MLTADQPLLLRCCNGCGAVLREATAAEVAAQRDGQAMPAAADVVASCGDQIQFRTAPSRASATHPAEPGTRGAFAELARGIAACAYVPGGITVLGRHWCVDHTACVEAVVEASEQASRGSAA